MDDDIKTKVVNLEEIRKQKEQAAMQAAKEMWQSLNPAQKVGMSPIGWPVTDLVGLAGDAKMYWDEPETRSGLNYSLSGLGLLPFVPGVVKSIGKKGKPAKADTSYRMQHQPRGREWDDSIQLDDLTKDISGNQAGYPDYFYSQDGKRIFAQGPRFADDEYGIANEQSYNAIIKARNNPEAEIIIYRAVPKGIDRINDGDFVTLSPKYAELHASSGFVADPLGVAPGQVGGDAGVVITKKVKVKDVIWDANDVNEFGYYPVD